MRTADWVMANRVHLSKFAGHKDLEEDKWVKVVNWGGVDEGRHVVDVQNFVLVTDMGRYEQLGIIAFKADLPPYESAKPRWCVRASV